MAKKTSLQKIEAGLVELEAEHKEKLRQQERERMEQIRRYRSDGDERDYPDNPAGRIEEALDKR